MWRLRGRRGLPAPPEGEEKDGAVELVRACVLALREGPDFPTFRTKG